MSQLRPDKELELTRQNRGRETVQTSDHAEAEAPVEKGRQSGEACRDRGTE